MSMFSFTSIRFKIFSNEILIFFLLIFLQSLMPAGDLWGHGYNLLTMIWKIVKSTEQLEETKVLDRVHGPELIQERA